MDDGPSELSVKKSPNKAPGIVIDGIPLAITGRRLKVASLASESWVEGRSDEEYAMIVRKLKAAGAAADIFMFSQRVPYVKPRFGYPLRWDNVAAIPLTTYDDWLRSVSTDMRKDLKRAVSRGVITKVVELNDELVRGIIEIHNE
jgi:hypothetical protein